MKTAIAVRDVDEETFRKFRALSIEDRRKLGDELTLAMQHWIEEKHGKRLNKVLEMKPVRIGTKKVRWSEEIDEILYGAKK